MRVRTIDAGAWAGTTSLAGAAGLAVRPTLLFLTLVSFWRGCGASPLGAAARLLLVVLLDELPAGLAAAAAVGAGLAALESLASLISLFPPSKQNSGMMEKGSGGRGDRALGAREELNLTQGKGPTKDPGQGQSEAPNKGQARAATRAQSEATNGSPTRA